MKAQLTLIVDSIEELQASLPELFKHMGAPAAAGPAAEMSVEQLLDRLRESMPGYRVEVIADDLPAAGEEEEAEPEEQEEEEAEPEEQEEEDEAPAPAKKKAPPPPAKKPAKKKAPPPAKKKRAPNLNERLENVRNEPAPKDEDYEPDTSSDPGKDMDKALALLVEIHKMPNGKTALEALRAKYAVTKFSLLEKARGTELLKDATILANSFGLEA